MSEAMLCLFNFGATELLLILLIVLVLFGSKQLPKLSKSIGESIKEFKKAKAEAEKEISEEEKKDNDLKKESDGEKREF
jgi:sec-independent protein translocase protein TatA